MKSIRDVLDELIQRVDSVRAEFTYTDDIDRNIELQVNVALISIAEIVENEVKLFNSINNYNKGYAIGYNEAIVHIAKLIRSEK